jgi:flavin-binding protein dodecin
MSDHVYAISEIVRSSSESIEDAIQNALARGEKQCETSTGSR